MRQSRRQPASQPLAFRVRQAAAADEASLVALDAAAWSPESGFPSVLQAAARPDAAFFSAENPPEIHLVAEAAYDQRVLGYARLKPPTPLLENAHVMHVAGLAVDASARGRGVATALLAAAERYASDRGARKLSLRVLGTNAPAIRVYERAGFVREGTLRGEFLIDGSYVDDLLMAKWLRPGEGKGA
jgi:ribosomal protein S18 acetylase RimI-like enzyme